MTYAVRGPLLIRANQIDQELKEVNIVIFYDKRGAEGLKNIELEL
jgi:hypothetical protein